MTLALDVRIVQFHDPKYIFWLAKVSRNEKIFLMILCRRCACYKAASLLRLILMLYLDYQV